MRQISFPTIKRVLELHFKGYTRDVIARKVGVSTGTVSNIISLLPEPLRELRALSVELRKSGKSTHEALKGAKLLSRLNDLGVELDQLEGYVKVTRKISRKAGYEPKQVVQAGMKLSSLEEQSGKSYPEVIREFKAKTKQVRKLDENVHELETRGQGLKKECKTTTKKLESLNKRSMKAQDILDKLDKAKEELATYGLRPDDFETVKNFLNEIHRLEGDPSKAVKILEETLSFEGKLQEKTDQFNRLKQLNKEEEEYHSRQVIELKQKKERLEKDIVQLLDYGKEVRRQFKDEEDKQREKIEGLTKLVRALEQQFDGLLKKQAALLKVQPDIDLVSEALPKRKEELEKSEQKIKENRTLITAAEAIAALLAKKPYDRNAVISYMQLTKHNTAYSSLDEHARQIIVKIMAEQGYVPVEDLEAVKKDAAEKIAECEALNKTWMNIAEHAHKRRRQEIEAYEKQREIERAAKDEKLEESIIKKAANIIAEMIKRSAP